MIGFSSSQGLPLAGFAKLVDDADLGGYCDNHDLCEVLCELQKDFDQDLQSIAGATEHQSKVLRRLLNQLLDQTSGEEENVNVHHPWHLNPSAAATTTNTRPAHTRTFSRSSAGQAPTAPVPQPAAPSRVNEEIGLARAPTLAPEEVDHGRRRRRSTDPMLAPPPALAPEEPDEGRGSPTADALALQRKVTPVSRSAAGPIGASLSGQNQGRLPPGRGPLARRGTIGTTAPIGMAMVAPEEQDVPHGLPTPQMAPPEEDTIRKLTYEEPDSGNGKYFLKTGDINLDSLLDDTQGKHVQVHVHYHNLPPQAQENVEPRRGDAIRPIVADGANIAHKAYLGHHYSSSPKGSPISSFGWDYSSGYSISGRPDLSSTARTDIYDPRQRSNSPRFSPNAVETPRTGKFSVPRVLLKEPRRVDL